MAPAPLSPTSKPAESNYLCCPFAANEQLSLRQRAEPLTVLKKVSLLTRGVKGEGRGSWLEAEERRREPLKEHAQSRTGARHSGVFGTRGLPRPSVFGAGERQGE